MLTAVNKILQTLPSFNNGSSDPKESVFQTAFRSVHPSCTAHCPTQTHSQRPRYMRRRESVVNADYEEICLFMSLAAACFVNFHAVKLIFLRTRSGEQ